MHALGPDDAARRLRDQLISGLGDCKDIESVEALKISGINSMEQIFRGYDDLDREQNGLTDWHPGRQFRCVPSLSCLSHGTSD